jgi:hypothetical protein
MKTSKLLRALESLSIISDKYKSINAGGCGVFALYLSEELEKRNVKHEIVWIGETCNNSKRVIRDVLNSNSNFNLQIFNENGVYLSHVMIKVGKRYVDAEGVFTGFNNTYWAARNRFVLAKITKKELSMLVESPEGWNPSFNRGLMPKIKKQVKKIIETAD